MKTIYTALVIVFCCFSATAVAQLEVQVGAGGHFSSLNEVFDGGTPSEFVSGDPAFRPYFSGLVGVSFSQKWNLRGRVVGTSRAERNLGEGLPGVEATTYSAYYVDLGAEFQWKPLAILGLSVGPYYAIDLNERVRTGDTSVDPVVELYDNYVAIRPAVELYFGPLVARLDTSFGLTPSQRLMYADLNGQLAGEFSRYWNGASLGLSYRLIKA